ncbi:MAG: DNA-processing protein DprA [Rickettsiales bacterium]|jgi:DNA processing protein|nr:DNA-processing protein DprA [Rickettsiales bacterium]
MEDLFDKLLILRTPGIGPVKYAELIRRFENPAAAADFLAPGDAIRDSVLRELEAAAKLGIKYLADDSPLYPPILRNIKNHPVVLTVRGNIDVFSKKSVAIVGTRHATAAGMRLVSELAESFAKNGHAVVSGMAIGTDSAAHAGALRAPGDSKTIAVLAGGADYIWPLENESLYYEIIERGAVVSEMPVGFQPVATNFIQRNRWVAGLSQKLILGEADLKSGSMATARFAIDYGLDLFAIPSHPADSRAAGPNSLIKSGAAGLCSGIEDFFGNVSNKNQPDLKKNKSENELIDKLGIIPLSESVLAGLVKKSIAEIKRSLVLLELQGLIAKRDGGYVRI